MNEKNIINDYSSNQKEKEKEKNNIEEKNVQTQKNQSFKENKSNDKFEMNNINTNKNNNANKENGKTQIYSKSFYCSILAEQMSRYSEMCKFLENEYKKDLQILIQMKEICYPLLTRI